MKIQFIFFLILMVSSINLPAQLRLGSATAEINFREGPGLNFKIRHTIDKSNLLVLLPREPKNKFIEVFDIETNAYGFVAENLIVVTDTLNYQQQQVFGFSGKNESGEIEIELVNQTSQTLFVWINNITYYLSPAEMKVLIMNTEQITYFSSAPGMYPVFGKEILSKGNSYRWKFTT